MCQKTSFVEHENLPALEQIKYEEVVRYCGQCGERITIPIISGNVDRINERAVETIQQLETELSYFKEQNKQLYRNIERLQGGAF